MTDQLEKFVCDGTPKDVIDLYRSLPKIASEADFGDYDRNIVVIDTETTGVSLKKNELTQIAAAKLEKGNVADWFVTFVNPGHPIPDDISHLTHITDADVANAPSPEEALGQLVDFVGDAKLVAHNAAFDRNFTTNHPAGYPLLENTWIDSLDLSRITLPRMKSHRLIDLVTAFGAPLSTHRADADVEATCALYRILLAGIETLPIELLCKIAKLASPAEWPTQPIFDFFAMRAIAEHEKSGGGEFLPHFNLRKMRKARTHAVTRHVKPDAAGMVSEQLLEETNMSMDGDVRVMEFPTSEEIEQAFQADGLVGQQYEDYEQRDQQLQMALAVNSTFASSTNLVVEASTGTGKSMAYLLPAALASVMNDISVGIATKTNALLDQIMYKELPQLAKVIERETGQQLTYSALKGFSHYPCLRKVQRVLDAGAQMRTVQSEERSQAPAIAALLSYIQQTEYDDMDSLKIDYRTLPRKAITTTSQECLRKKCPFYGTACYVHGSRKIAECSNVVVTNHSLFFCDVAAENALLPPIRYWIVDEAHGAEAEARRAMASEISLEELAFMASRGTRTDSKQNVFTRAERNVIPTAQARDKFMGALDGNAAKELASFAEAAESGIPEEEATTLFYALLQKGRAKALRFADAVEEFADRTRDLRVFDAHKKSSYETFDLWINAQVRDSEAFSGVHEASMRMKEDAEELLNACQRIVLFLEPIEGTEQIQSEFAVEVLQLKELTGNIEVIFERPTDEFVYFVTLSRRDDPQHKRPNRTAYCAMPFNVGAVLDETLYMNTRSVVYTSATLAVDGSFQTFESSVGLNSEYGQNRATHADSLMLDTCYDFDSNMTIYVPKDLPDPKQPSYLSKLQDFLVKAHVALDGSMLTLWTNKREMEDSFEAVNPHLKEANLRLVCQRWGVSNKGLRDDFLADEKLSLFALKSFWEGFDAPGATLRGVVIPKLPFASPDDPLSRERNDRDDRAWWHYDLPQSVIEVRQAVGRLIRNATDQGVVILADTRLISKAYGKTFLNSLPSSDVRFLTTDQICEELEEEHGQR